MTDYIFIKGYYVNQGSLGRMYRYKCKKCGTFITSKPRLQRVWGGKKQHYTCPYCPTCKKFMRYNTMNPVDEIYKPYG